MHVPSGLLHMLLCMAMYGECANVPRRSKCALREPYGLAPLSLMFFFARSQCIWCLSFNFNVTFCSRCLFAVLFGCFWFGFVRLLASVACLFRRLFQVTSHHLFHLPSWCILRFCDRWHCLRREEPPDDDVASAKPPSCEVRPGRRVNNSAARSCGGKLHKAQSCWLRARRSWRTRPAVASALASWSAV